MPAIDTVIDTGRLLLRRFTTDDLDAFCQLGSRPEIEDTELGYRFLPEFWGMGLATEAGAASIEFARSTLGLGLPGIDIELFARSLATPRSAAGVP